MKIVIDTNVLISGVFFGGYPKQVLKSITDHKFECYASAEIINEYKDITDEMISRKQGKLNSSILDPFINALNIIEPTSNIDICRDKDDNKFINCALDSKALYIVSGDNDLLVLKQVKNIKIITAKDFFEEYLG